MAHRNHFEFADTRNGDDLKAPRPSGPFHLDNLQTWGLDIGPKNTGAVKLSADRLVADVLLQAKADHWQDRVLEQDEMARHTTGGAHLIAVEFPFVRAVQRAITMGALIGNLLAMAHQRHQFALVLRTAQIDSLIGLADFRRELGENEETGKPYTRKEAIALLCERRTGRRLGSEHLTDAWAVAWAGWLWANRNPEAVREVLRTRHERYDE
jgi:hypothetical protein